MTISQWKYFVYSMAIIFWLMPINQVMAEKWNVGFRSITINDSILERKIEVALWYPTQETEKRSAIGPTFLSIARDAQPIKFTKGLVLFSHGFSGSFLGHNDTAQFLAQSGFFVATPTHPDKEDLLTQKPEYDPLVIRPRQISLLIDTLLKNRFYKTIIPKNQISAIGYSLGAYSTLVAIGAIPSIEGIASYCLEKPGDEMFCSDWAKKRFASISNHLKFKSDDRIKKAILLAPAYGPLFTKKSFVHISIPVKIFSAENDEELDNRYNAKFFSENIVNNVGLQVIQGAGHYTFMVPCPEGLKNRFPFLCADQEGVDRILIHRNLNMDIKNFLNKAL